MLGGLRRALLVAVVAGAALAAPTAAFACSGGPSAVNVYKECLPTGSGAKPTSGARKHSAGRKRPSTSVGTSTLGGRSTSGAKATSSKPHRVSHRTAKALKDAGNDKAVLSRLLSTSTPRLLQSSNSTPAPAPSAIGSAFDLGSGPTVLLALLAGTALLLLGVTGLRVWRDRQQSA